MSQTVSELLVGVLEQIGVRQVFGLIGDSLNPLADAVRRSKIEWIGVRHEEGAALAAAGQAKLTGRLGVCAGTTGPGSNHLVELAWRELHFLGCRGAAVAGGGARGFLVAGVRTAGWLADAVVRTPRLDGALLRATGLVVPGVGAG